MEIIEFIFKNIFTFLGTVIILGVIFDGITQVIKQLKK